MRTRQNILSKYIEMSPLCDVPPSSEEIERRIALYSQRADRNLPLFADENSSEFSLTNPDEGDIMGSLDFDWSDSLEEMLNEQE